MIDVYLIDPLLTVTYLVYSVHFVCFLFFFSSRRRHTRCYRDWSSDVCSSDLAVWREDLRALDLAADPLAVEWELRVLDEVAGETFAASHRRANLLPLLVKEGAATAHRRVPRGHRSGGTRPDPDDVVLLRSPPGRLTWF